jgi:hypothetical protein
MQEVDERGARKEQEKDKLGTRGGGTEASEMHERCKEGVGEGQERARGVEKSKRCTRWARYVKEGYGRTEQER